MQRRDANLNMESGHISSGMDVASNAAQSRKAGPVDGSEKIPLIRRSRQRDELEYDLLLVLLWASKNVPSEMFDQIYTLIWSFTRLDDGEREKALADIRSLGDARFGEGRDAKSPPKR